MRKKYIIPIVILVIIILGVGSVFIYRNVSTNKEINKGIELMSQKEYEKSLACFDLALDSNSNNDKALQLKEMVNTYLDSKKLFESGEVDEANKEINDINQEYSNYNGFKDDVNDLKNQINSDIKNNKEINDKIDKVRGEIDKKDYNEAKSLITNLEKEKLDKNQKQQVEDLKGRVNSELEKIESEKKLAESKKLEEEKKKAEGSSKADNGKVYSKDEVNNILKSLNKGSLGSVGDLTDRVINGENCYVATYMWGRASNSRPFWVGSKTLTVYNYDDQNKGSIYDDQNFQGEF